MPGMSESRRTTKLYDRTKDDILLSDVERIRCDIAPKLFYPAGVIYA
jgi:hypothetical protein